jgi:outer membrane protein TolC
MNHLIAVRLRGPIVAIVATTIGLAGCASFSEDGAMAPMHEALQPHLKADAPWARSDAERRVLNERVAGLLAQPLHADDAVQIALLNNKRLQASYAELGLAEADVVQAGRLLNPALTLGRSRQGSEVEREVGLQIGLVHLLTMPLTGPLAQRQLEQAQRDTALRVLSLAHATRRAYYVAVAADESVRHLQRANAVAEAGAELARRMADAGNWSALQQAREQGLLADTALRLADAMQNQSATRERLVRLLGVDSASVFTLPERLPDLPDAAQALPVSEQQAMDQRIDLQSFRLQADAAQKRLGLVRTTRFINVLELGGNRITSNEEPTQRGVELRFELPLFDWGGARTARAETLYRQTLDRAADAAVNARSEVREAHIAYRTRYDIARRFKDEVLPLRKRISDENLRRYNGMLIGVFDLLADARAQIDAVDGAIHALRDFWLAQADLDMALAGPVRGDLF